MRCSPRSPRPTIVASPLLRARETMEIVRDAMGLDPRRLHARRAPEGNPLRPLAGHARRRICRASMPPGIEARARDPFRWRPHGGESYEDLMARVGRLAARTSTATRSSPRTAASAACCADISTGSTSPIVPELDVPQDRVLVLRRDGMTGSDALQPDKRRAEAAAAPALPSLRSRPLGAGCSGRQGAALMFGHGRKRPSRDAYVCLRHATGGFTPLKLRNVAKPVVPRPMPDGDRRFSAKRRCCRRDRASLKRCVLSRAVSVQLVASRDAVLEPR